MSWLLSPAPAGLLQWSRPPAWWYTRKISEKLPGQRKGKEKRQHLTQRNFQHYIIAPPPGYSYSKSREGVWLLDDVEIGGKSKTTFLAVLCTFFYLISQSDFSKWSKLLTLHVSKIPILPNPSPPPPFTIIHPALLIWKGAQLAMGHHPMQWCQTPVSIIRKLCLGSNISTAAHKSIPTILYSMISVIRGAFFLTRSHSELTKDNVLPSGYVKIFRTVTRNAINKSVWRKKDCSWLPLNKHAMNIFI